MYYLDDDDNRIYTLDKVAPDGTPTMSAHPARFSPDDKFSEYRVGLKKRWNMLPHQIEERKKAKEEAKKAEKLVKEAKEAKEEKPGKSLLTPDGRGN